MRRSFTENGRRGRRAKLAGLAVCASLVALPSGTALAGGGGVGTGGGDDSGTVAGSKAKLKRNGIAVPPENAPRRVKDAIHAANKIHEKPYKWGGGHSSWRDSGYDCSGAVSYALGKPGARLIKSPMPSGGFTNVGRKGKGDWITVYANSGHMFVVIAGLRFDTSQPDDGKSGPGWSKDVKRGFVNVSKRTARHWRGL